MTRAHAVLISLAALGVAFATSAQSLTTRDTTDGYPALSIPQAQSGYIPFGGAPSYVTGFSPGSPGSMANLPTPNGTNVGQYAVVNDLYGNTNEVLRAGYTAGFGYYWRPQRTDYGTSLTSTGGALTLTPLANAPYIYLSGQLASSLTINLSTTNAWPGASFCVSNNLTLGVLTLSVAGSGLPSTNMIGGASKCFVFDGNSAAWRPF